MNALFLTVKMALRGLFTNWGRSLLTMLGIIIGVASVITIMAVGDGAQALLTSTIASSGTKNISVLAGASNDNGPPAIAQGIVIKTLTDDDAYALQDISSVAAVNAELSGSFDVVYAGKSENVNVSGVLSAYVITENHPVARGRFFTPEEVRSASPVVVLGSDMARDLFRAQSPVGQKMKIGKSSFMVIGVLKTKGGGVFRNPDNGVYVPLGAMQKRLLNEKHVQRITAMVYDESQINRTKESMKSILRYRHGIDDPEQDDFSVRSVNQALDIISGVTSAVSLFLAMIAGVSLIVGGIGIMNIMLMNVNQRTREIGLRKALGAKPNMIRNQFLTESLVLTIMGGIIGTAIGIFLSWVIAIGAQYAGYDWVFSIRPEAILLGVGLAGLTGYVFGSGPAKKAAALNAIDALRHE